MMFEPRFCGPLPALLIALSSLALVACGGGGGGASDGSGAPSVDHRSPTQAEGVTPEPSTPGTDEWAIAQAASVITYPSLLSAGYLKGSGWLTSVADPDTSPGTYTPHFTGRAWYVDADNGADTNAGTLAAPWKTLQRVTSARASAGDALLLKCGAVWRESLEITTANFAPNGQLLIGGYGDCTNARRPVIKGSDLIGQTGWQKVSGGADQVYVRAYTQAPDRLFANSKPLFKARFPDYNGVGAEFALAVGHGSSNSFTVASQDLVTLAGKAVVGATVYLHTTPWQIDKATVTQFDAGTGRITLDRAMSRNIDTGVGYILEGKRWMLDAPGEWWFDAVNNQLYVWTPGSVSPAGLDNLEASWRTHGLSVRWVPDVKVEHIRFEQQADTALLLVETPRITVSGVHSAYAGEYGLSMLSADNAIIQDSVITASGYVGLDVREGAAVQVLRNKVSDNGLFGHANNSDAAISVIAQGTVEGNLVHRSANQGIRFGNRAGTTVRNNTVLVPCVRLTDCAGIHTFTAPYPALAPSAYSARALVEGNIVVGARSNTNGLGPNSVNQAMGIYLDELTSGTTVSNNVVVGTETGLAIHNAAFNVITGNAVRGVAYASFWGTLTRSDADVMRGNVVSNNSFVTHRAMKLESGGVPMDGDQTFAQIWLHASDSSQIFSGANPNVSSGNEALSSQAATDARWRVGTPSAATTLNLDTWRAYGPTDRHANSVTYKAFKPNLAGASLIENGSFATGNTTPWVTYFDPTGHGSAFSAVASSLCTSSPCARFVPGASPDYLISAPFALDGTPGQNLYLLRYAATGGVGGGVSRAMIRRQVSPYENFGLNIQATELANGESSRVEKYFRATGAQNAVLDFRGKISGETYLSEVSLHRVQSVDFPNRASLVGTIVNTQTTSVSYTCAMLALQTCDTVDEAGRVISWPLVLPGRSAITLFARDAQWLAL